MNYIKATETADIKLGKNTPQSSITSSQISDLVELFYSRIRSDEVLSPIFVENMKSDWPTHLGRMKCFWRSVLLKTGEYKGRPIPVHQKIAALTEDDFAHWLKLFSQTVEEVFSDDQATLVINTAKNIASSLWLSRAKDPFAIPPNWQIKKSG